MKHAIAEILATLVSFVLLDARAVAAEEQTLKDRFDQEAIPAWTRLRQAIDGWEVLAVIVATFYWLRRRRRLS